MFIFPRLCYANVSTSCVLVHIVFNHVVSIGDCGGCVDNTLPRKRKPIYMYARLHMHGLLASIENVRVLGCYGVLLLWGV